MNSGGSFLFFTLKVGHSRPNLLTYYVTMAKTISKRTVTSHASEKNDVIFSRPHSYDKVNTVRADTNSSKEGKGDKLNATFEVLWLKMVTGCTGTQSRPP